MSTHSLPLRGDLFSAADREPDAELALGVGEVDNPLVFTTVPSLRWHLIAVIPDKVRRSSIIPRGKWEKAKETPTGGNQ